MTRVQLLLEFGELLDSEVAEGSGEASVGLELVWSEVAYASGRSSPRAVAEHPGAVTEFIASAVRADGDGGGEPRRRPLPDLPRRSVWRAF